MPQRLYTNCGLDCHGGTAGFSDDSLVKLTRGMIRSDQVLASAPAVLAVAGADADGLVTYSAAGGRWGNEITVEHLEGATGVGNEDRALEVAVDAKAITVTFGTDGAGASLLPTASELAAEVAGNEAATRLVTATAGGTGASAAGLAAAANLAGGENTGDYLCLGPGGRFTMLVNTVEVF